MKPGMQAQGGTAGMSTPRLGGRGRKGARPETRVPELLSSQALPVFASQNTKSTVPVWFVISCWMVACTRQPATPASTAVPPSRITWSMVSVTMGCWLLATAFLPRTTGLGPRRGRGAPGAVLPARPGLRGP